MNIIETIGSPIAILCSLALQRYAFFSRLSILDFSVRIDMVLFTELNQCLFGHIQQFCGTSPCSGTDIGPYNTVSFRFRITMCQVFAVSGRISLKTRSSAEMVSPSVWKAAIRTVSFNSRMLPGHG